jgi:undecaprenyl-diphosphatase
MNEEINKISSDETANLNANFSQRIWGFIGLRLLIGLVLAIVALFFFGWLTDEVLEGATVEFDNSVRLFVHGLASPSTTALMRLSTFLGSTIFLIGLGLGIAVAFYFANWRRAVVLFMITMAGAIILNFVLKTIFQRTRPEPYFDTPLPSSFSFPSGHALFSVCFYGVLAWLVTSRIKNGAAQASIWILSVLLIFFIGLSRVYLGVHYPSDVIAGYTAAFIWVFAVGFGDSILRRRASVKKTDI